MKCPTKQTVAERYEFILNSCSGSHDKAMAAAQAELELQKAYENQDHPKIKRNIAKLNEFIDYAKTQQFYQSP